MFSFVMGSFVRVKAAERLKSVSLSISSSDSSEKTSSKTDKLERDGVDVDFFMFEVELEFAVDLFDACDEDVEFRSLVLELFSKVEYLIRVLDGAFDILAG